MYKRFIIFFIALAVVSQLGSAAYAYTPDDIAAEARAAQAQPQQIAGWKILLNNITKLFGFEAFKAEFSESYAKEGTREGDQAEKDNCEAAGGSWVTGPGGFRGTCTPDTRSAGSGGQASNPSDPAGNVDPGPDNDGGGGTGGRDLDGDGYPIRNDCDDRDDLVNPGRDEIVGNGKDDDCNPNTPDERQAEKGSNDEPQSIVVPTEPTATPTPKTSKKGVTVDGFAEPAVERATFSDTAPTIAMALVDDSIRVNWNFASGEAWPRDWIALLDANENIPQDPSAWGRATNVWKYVHNGKNERTTSAGSSGSVILRIPQGVSSVRAVYYRDNGFTLLAHDVLVITAQGTSLRPGVASDTVATATPVQILVTPSVGSVTTTVTAPPSARPNPMSDCTLEAKVRKPTLASDMSFFDRVRSVVSGSSASQLPESDCPRIISITPRATTVANQRVIIAGSGFTTKGNVVYFLRGATEVARVMGTVSFNRSSITVAAPTLSAGTYNVRVMNDSGKIGNAIELNVLSVAMGSAEEAALAPSTLPEAQITPTPTMQPTRVSQPTLTVVPTRAPRPTPLPRVGCSPTTQTVGIGDPVTLTAFGGAGSYTWRAPKSSVLAGDGEVFTTVYEKRGRYYVSVRDGSRTRSCRVTVTQ
ncbi:MAG: IPT/TIG domain-containing protein [Patescibacteria group bacterium]